MSGVFGSGTKVTNYSGIDIQSTSASLPIPIIYGQAMLTPNLVDYDGFKKVKKGAKGNFGKGGILSSGEEIYTADVIMAIGEGPISSIVGIYQTSYTLLSSTQCGLSLIGGSIGQSPTYYWSSNAGPVSLKPKGLRKCSSSTASTTSRHCCACAQATPARWRAVHKTPHNRRERHQPVARSMAPAKWRPLQAGAWSASNGNQACRVASAHRLTCPSASKRRAHQLVAPLKAL